MKYDIIYIKSTEQNLCFCFTFGLNFSEKPLEHTSKCKSKNVIQHERLDFFRFCIELLDFWTYNGHGIQLICGCLLVCMSVYSWTRSANIYFILLYRAVIESNANWTHFFDVDDGHPPIYYYLGWFYLLNTLTLTLTKISK